MTILNEMENKYWTLAIEKNVQLIGNLSIGYKWMHTRSAKIFGRRYRHMTYLIGIINAVTTFLLIIDALYVRSFYPDSYILSLIAAGMTMLTTIIDTIVVFGGYQDLAEDHQTFAAKYTSLTSNIRRQLNLKFMYRENAPDYLSWIAKNYDELFEMAPLIRGNLIKEYTKIAEKKGLPIPEETLMEICAGDIVNRDTDVPFILHHPSVNINQRMGEYKDETVINISPQPEESEESSSPLNVINTSPNWSPRKNGDTGSSMSIGTARTPRRKERKLYKSKPTSNKVIVDINKFDDQRMQFELNRLRTSRK